MTDIRKCGGYQMVDKAGGLDLDHTILVMKVIGQFHGLSWVYKTKKELDSLRSEFPYLVDTILSTDSAGMLLESNFVIVEEIAKQNFGSDSPAFRGLQKLKEVGLAKVFSAFLHNDFSDPTVSDYLDGICKEDEDSGTVVFSAHFPIRKRVHFN